ncbi:hydroxyacid dehydrogenase [Paenibacillus filicis]|uniref:Hydroxyacid dehydrogenase n=1 Tax=Paenibacillus gyeongsangnamensis TaxID=3388067 RepID=A0ABT4QD34_9BACL|nr:hydroxyacid dehydrogenase [Paenibacillus filicis]MCZ8514769.1 hydroxyacid dehydrogenase [Paenibacillus filicis]
MRTILVQIPHHLIPSFMTESTLAKLDSLGRVEWNPFDRPFTEDELKSRIRGVDTLITSWRCTPVSDAVLDEADQLALVAHMAGSIRPVFPTWSVYDRGIKVLNSNYAIAVSVSESVLALILAIGHKILAVDREMKAGITSKHVGMETYELRGKTVGLVGLGMVAREVIKLLQPFGTTILGYDPFMSEEKAQELGVRLLSLQELLTQSDIVSLHAPKVPETYHMIGREELALIKDGAIFINTARGDLINEEALLAELKKNRFYAGLDVFTREPLAVDSEFRRMNNVIVRPHLAGVNPDSCLRIGKLMVEDMERLYKGDAVYFEVKREQLAIMT